MTTLGTPGSRPGVSRFTNGRNVRWRLVAALVFALTAACGEEFGAGGTIQAHNEWSQPVVVSERFGEADGYYYSYWRIEPGAESYLSRFAPLDRLIEVFEADSCRLLGEWHGRENDVLIEVSADGTVSFRTSGMTLPSRLVQPSPTSAVSCHPVEASP